MSKFSHRFSLMILPKGFISLLGAEYELMRKAGGNILLRFYFASVGILIISVISFLSVRYAIDLLFHNVAVEIALSVFISLLFVVLYIFLINTFSKKKMDQTNESGSKKTEWYRQKDLWTLTNISRTGFILFMAFILSKPIEIFVLKDILNEKTALYKQSLVKEHTKKIEELFTEDEFRLRKDIASQRQLNIDHATDAVIAQLNQLMDSLSSKKQVFIKNAEKRIHLNSFFIYRVRLATTKYPVSWLIWIIVTFIFLLPGYLIYSISHEQEYYRLKSEMETDMIIHAWTLFNEQYRNVFKQRYNYEASFYSVYEDPPFNTKRKPGPVQGETDDFFSKYLNPDHGL